MWTGERSNDLPPQREWQRIKRAVHARDRYRCQHCGHKGTYETLDCDHTGDRADHRLEVLQTLCRPCHKIKTGEQSHESARTNRAKLTHPSAGKRHPGMN